MSCLPGGSCRSRFNRLPPPPSPAGGEDQDRLRARPRIRKERADCRIRAVYSDFRRPRHSPTTMPAAISVLRQDHQVAAVAHGAGHAFRARGDIAVTMIAASATGTARVTATLLAAAVLRTLTLSMSGAVSPTGLPLLQPQPREHERGASSQRNPV